jgi:hypothetical protein
MEASKRSRRPSQSTSQSPEPSQGEAGDPARTRVDKRCPTRYYPLYPIVARRRIPIRYY